MNTLQTAGEAMKSADEYQAAISDLIRKPFRKQGQQMAYDGDDKVFFDCFSAEQLQTAIAASRLKALEDAAVAVAGMKDYSLHTRMHIGKVIKDLKGETT